MADKMATRMAEEYMQKARFNLARTRAIDLATGASFADLDTLNIDEAIKSLRKMRRILVELNKG
jgi:hypothetical protein